MRNLSLARALRMRPGTAVAAGVLAAVTAISTVSGAAPAAQTFVPTAATVPTTSSAHPYSMPVWLPVHTETYLDCVLSNPGCGNTHGHWTTDMVEETLNGSAPKSPGVYAMGAGIMHVQVAKGASCHNSGTTTFGTTVWIDHGAGVISRYGHLGRILYKSGTRLAAGQEFATMGTTGKIGNCGVPYVDFQVRTHGLTGPTKRLDTLLVCSSATTSSTWPPALNARQHIRPAPLYPSKVKTTNSSFNEIPKRTVDFPATTGACIPSGVPATPNTPSGVRLTPAGRGKLAVSWSKAPTTPRTTSVQVQLSQYHPSTHTWDYSQNEQYRTVSPTATRSYFTGLVSGHKYRATVVLRNGAGYGRSVVTGAVTSVGKPGKPGHRRSFVTHTKKSATVHFRWTRPKEYGLRVTGFVVQERRLFKHHVSSWYTVRMSRAHVSWHRSHLKKHSRYQMRVQAIYHGGATAFRYTRLRT